MNKQVTIRKTTGADFDGIWHIIKAVIATEDTYVFPADTPRDEMLQYWCGEDKLTYVAIKDDNIVGTFFIKANFPGLGAHIANASFMTHPEDGGHGVGNNMGRYALKEAKRLGFLAMQFNIVVKNNERAIRLWQKLGFKIVGEIPDAFKHKSSGLTNAYVMWRKL